MPPAARNFLFYWVPVLLWAGMIFSLSTDLGSVKHTSRFIGPFLRWLIPGITDPSIGFVQMAVRKAGHGTEYAMLALLLWRALYRPERRIVRPWSSQLAWYSWLGAAAYAASDEFHQSFYPSREASLRDVLIDATGAAAGLLALRALGRWRNWWLTRPAVPPA